MRNSFTDLRTVSNIWFLSPLSLTNAAHPPIPSVTQVSTWSPASFREAVSHPAMHLDPCHRPRSSLASPDVLNAFSNIYINEASLCAVKSRGFGPMSSACIHNDRVVQSGLATPNCPLHFTHRHCFPCSPNPQQPIAIFLTLECCLLQNVLSLELYTTQLFQAGPFYTAICM